MKPRAARAMVEAPDEADAALLAQIARGDLGALGTLFDRHRAAVRGFAIRATGDHADAEDLVHNTFLTAARIAARFDGRASCRPWLVGIAARLVQQRARRLARVARYLARFATTQPAASDPVPALEARDALGAVAGALGRMSVAKRVVLLMAEVEGMTCEDIARALDVPIGTVWTRLHHARRELLAAMPRPEDA